MIDFSRTDMTNRTAGGVTDSILLCGRLPRQFVITSVTKER